MKLFQGLVNQVREVIDTEFGIVDDTGLILANTNEKLIGQYELNIIKILQAKENFVVIDGASYLKVYIKNKMDFIIYLKSDNPDNLNYLSLLAINISNIKEYHDEKFDKNNFLKNIIQDNILPGDIQFRSKELHVTFNAFRVVFLIKTENDKDLFVNDAISALFPNKTKDFIINPDSENTVLIKELKTGDDFKEVQKTAKLIVDSLNTDMDIQAHIGIGTIVSNLKDVARSYKEAQISLLVGGIFESHKQIINYNSLGIGRLIYQLPTTLCKLFLKEVFREGSFESLDSETLVTIEKFFENNLNVSETSRQLYVHRNTLVYRLDKIEKITGLDLRKFDDAIIFKVAMLVKKYLENGEKMM